MTQAFEIIGMGYASQDNLVIVPRIPLDDKVEIISSLLQGGGPGATATVAAARLGARTAFIGAIGDDERGMAILDEFRREGVNVDFVFTQQGVVSPAAYCWIDSRSSSRSIAWTRGGISPLSEDLPPADEIRAAKLLHLDGHHTRAAIAAAEIAKKAGTTISLDAGTILDGMGQLVELADIVIASEVFAREFTGEADLNKAARRLHRCGKTKFAGVTAGKNGSIGFDGIHEYHQASFAVEVVDTTGAGDVYHGAFAYQHLKGGDWSECMRFASAVAAMKCMELGGRSGIPTQLRAEQFLRSSKCT